MFFQLVGFQSWEKQSEKEDWKFMRHKTFEKFIFTLLENSLPKNAQVLYGLHTWQEPDQVFRQEVFWKPEFLSKLRTFPHIKTTAIVVDTKIRTFYMTPKTNWGKVLTQ